LLLLLLLLLLLMHIGNRTVSGLRRMLLHVQLLLLAGVLESIASGWGVYSLVTAPQQQLHSVAVPSLQSGCPGSLHPGAYSAWHCLGSCIVLAQPKLGSILCAHLAWYLLILFADVSCQWCLSYEVARTHLQQAPAALTICSRCCIHCFHY
jgi:hypothetical protein